MKEYLKKIIAAKEKRAAEIRELIKNSEDVNEVRSLGEELQGVTDEKAEAEAELAKVEADEAAATSGEGKGDEGEERGFNPLGTYGVRNSAEFGEGIDSLEYRTAFMNLVTKNTPIPTELRGNANTLTTDVTSVIPTVLVNRIVERMESCGMILQEVMRTAYAAGVVVPTSSVKPVASWVAEGATSDKQKKTTDKVVFSYYKLRCEISMSMEVGTMALSAFEDTFVKNVADAMIIAIEKAILAGNGTDRPQGIITAGVGTYTEHVITTTGKTGAWTYKDLVAAEAALPVEHEGTAKWFMTKKQFMDIIGMTDENGQPVARVDHGVDGAIARTLLGREVIVHPYATEMGNNLAGIFDFNDYVLNTIYDMGIQKKQDWDTEDLLTKAVMSVDGKVIDNYSLILVQAGA